MKLYDRACFKCGYMEVDCVAKSSSDLDGPCPECTGRLQWKPSFGSVESGGSFYDPHMGKRYTSFRAMERDAASKGFAVVGKGEFEAGLGKTDRLEEKISRDDKRLESIIEKSHYRLQHGYKD